MKTCTKCQVEKDEGEFFFRGGKGALRGSCKQCDTLSKLRWHHANPDRQRGYQLIQKYGITLADYNARLEAQGGRCANPGCRTDVPGGRGAFAVDHDHQTGKVRALLCKDCNTSLGALGDCYDNDKIAGLLQYAFEQQKARDISGK